MAKNKKTSGTSAENKNSLVRTIILTQAKRGGIDISTFTSAVKAAENIDTPKRIKLYDLYDEVLTDGHLSAVIQKRKSTILNTPIEFKRNGKTDDEVTSQLRSPWFYNFISDLLDTIYWGHSLFQFYRDGEWINYDLIPRKHVNPEKKLILKKQDDTSGESFDTYPDLIAIGKARDLGLLVKAAPYVIYKRNAMADWAQHVELNGQPLREGTYDGWDEEAREKLTEDLYNMGGSAVIVHPEGTKINIHDLGSKSANSEFYKLFVEFCNSEKSKLILGNTLTTEAGDKGTQALGTVHLGVEEKIERTDKQFVLNVLNYDLTDIFVGLGLNTQDGEFAFVVPQNKDLSARIMIDTQLKGMGLPISDDYLYETYGIEKPKNYEELKQAQKTVSQDPEKEDPEKSSKKDDPEEKEVEKDKKDKSLINQVKSFFV